MTAVRRVLSAALVVTALGAGLIVTRPGLLPVAARTTTGLAGGGPCTLEPMSVSYRTAFRGQGYVVTHADVSGLPETCTGVGLRIDFLGASGLLGSGRLSALTTGLATVVVPDVLAEPVTSIHVEMNGKKVAYPPECDHVIAGIRRVITGSTADDGPTYANDRENALMLALSGNDRFSGRDGIDCVVGGPGNDVVSGGDKSANVVLGGGGDDHVYAGNGDDRLYGGEGADRVEGNDGNDLLVAGVGADSLLGGNGNDTLVAGDGTVLVDGGAGRNVCELPRGFSGRHLNCGTVKRT